MSLNGIFSKLITLLLFANSSSEKNVCYVDFAYAAKQNNPLCFYNPDLDSTPEQIALRQGYVLERHYNITTEDGYHLTLFHIITHNSTSSQNRQPVLLHHGIAADALILMSRGSDSLAFFLMKNGYDVWIANTRGTKYSRTHENLNIDQAQYWNFSFHEIGTKDLPAEIEYIAAKTKRAGDILFIGHSMGNTVASVYATVLREHAKKYLKGAISLCPVTYIGHMKGLIGKFPEIVASILKLLLSYDVYEAFSHATLWRNLLNFLCSSFPSIEVCRQSLYSAAGPSSELSPQDFLTLFISWPDGVSLKMLENFVQNVISKKFRQYDYGENKNLEIYKKKSPPEYDVSQINIPFHLFYGGNDYIAVEKDAYIMYNALETKKKSIQMVNNFNHVDFLFAKNLESALYPLLLEKLEELK